MQRDGDLVLRFHGAVVWASNTSVHGSHLLMQPDGDLVIQHGGRTLWRSHTGRLATPADGRPFLDVEPSGRFTVNFTPPDATGGPAERSVFDSAHRPGEAGRVADGALHVMTTGSVLHSGQSLISGNGFRLTMHANGNLVQRGPHGAVRWQTRTAGYPSALLQMRRNGNLVSTRASASSGRRGRHERLPASRDQLRHAVQRRRGRPRPDRTSCLVLALGPVSSCPEAGGGSGSKVVRVTELPVLETGGSAHPRQPAGEADDGAGVVPPDGQRAAGSL